MARPVHSRSTLRSKSSCNSRVVSPTSYVDDSSYSDQVFGISELGYCGPTSDISSTGKGDESSYISDRPLSEANQRTQIPNLRVDVASPSTWCSCTPKRTEKTFARSRPGTSQARLLRDDKNRAYLRELKKNGSLMCVVLYGRDGDCEKELSVKKGDILKVMDNSRTWWKVRNFKGEIGYAPYTVLEEIKGAH